MSDFSSILSSINGKAQVPQQAANPPRPKTADQQTKRPTNLVNGAKLSTNNVTAGVKRRSEEPQSDPRAKAARVEKNDGSANKPAAAPQSRFQLSSKPGITPKAQGVPHRPTSSPTTASTSQKSAPKSTAQSAAAAAQNANTPSNIPAKRGFASIMEKAKAAQEAAKATGASGIKHKAVEKPTKRERMKMAAEEAEAQRQAEKRRKNADTARSKNGERPVGLQKGQEGSYEGTMRKAPEALAYKGTMRNAVPGSERERAKKLKGQAQDKYGGYASWSDLSDAEDDDEEDDGYDSEGSSDMEGGFDDVEREELSATRAARREDQEALEEEERLKREKVERKRKLMSLSKDAATRNKY